MKILRFLNSIILFLLIFILLSSCIKDRIFPVVANKSTATLVINEFVAMGSTNVNEFGETNDWIEIYNNTNNTIELKKNEWYITNDETNKQKFALPPMSIYANQFVIIWCDGLDTVANAIHSNFKISAAGSILLLNKKVVNEPIQEIDKYAFGQQQAAISVGRFPDGNESWLTFTAPSPGNENK